MQNIWYEEHVIRHSQFDREGNFKLHAWSDLLQEAAANHAAELGVGMLDLNAKNQLWVLAQLKVQFFQAPCPGESVRVATYPSGTRRLFALREYEIKNASDERLLAGSSRWILLDKATLRPLSALTIADQLPDNSGLPVYFDFAEKLPVPENYDFFYDVAIRHSMEDVNGHLNNAEYLAAAQDALCANGIVKKFQGFEIAYHHSLRAPEILTIGVRQCGNDAIFTGFNAARERCVSGKLIYQ